MLLAVLHYGEAHRSETTRSCAGLRVHHYILKKCRNGVEPYATPVSTLAAFRLQTTCIVGFSLILFAIGSWYNRTKQYVVATKPRKS